MLRNAVHAYLNIFFQQAQKKKLLKVHGKVLVAYGENNYFH